MECFTYFYVFSQPPRSKCHQNLLKKLHISRKKLVVTNENLLTHQPILQLAVQSFHGCGLMSNGLLLRKAGFLTQRVHLRFDGSHRVDPWLQNCYTRCKKDWCGMDEILVSILGILGILLHKWMVSMVSPFEAMDLQLVRQGSSDSVASDSNSCFACSFLGSLGPVDQHGVHQQGPHQGE